MKTKVFRSRMRACRPRSLHRYICPPHLTMLSQNKMPTCKTLHVCRLIRFPFFSFRPPMSPTLRNYRSCEKYFLTFSDILTALKVILLSHFSYAFPTLLLYCSDWLKRSCRGRVWRILLMLRGAVGPVEKLTCRYKSASSTDSYTNIALVH